MSCDSGISNSYVNMFMCVMFVLLHNKQLNEYRINFQTMYFWFPLALPVVQLEVEGETELTEICGQEHQNKNQILYVKIQ